MYIGGRQMVAHTLLLPAAISRTTFSWCSWWPRIMQVVSIGTQLTEALAGLERTQEVMGERPEDQDPKRSIDAVRWGTIEFDNVSFSYDGAHEVLHNIRPRLRAGYGDRAGGLFRVGQIHERLA